ncbi:NAD(P)H-hydrate epimerase [Crystallibacter degradans]|uniref:NAD(P)H-hydrate epimerase n=1 Tax=Crystallibacter degradans TaxID=2726743 RepID=UPI0014750AFC|nr:NAD(P)H-hydrate epimerase [Arthrobacter sp. SF27]NMR29369.1 NAD(P)H-hydrate epimerase [Arthrobacter sp. SF27]
MISAWTGGQIRAAEQPLLDAGHGDRLMATAAHGLANAVVRAVWETRGRIYGARLVVLAGSGNNGGDALFAAAALARRGMSTTAVLTSARSHWQALTAFENAGGTVLRLVAGDDGTAAGTDVSAAAAICSRADALIDGILGTGASGGLRSPAKDLVEDIIALGTPALTVACDLPSGVSADTGEVFGPVLPADLTVTFGGTKAGLLTDPAAGLAGRVRTVDIGLGPHLPAPELRQLEPADLAGWWPVPQRTSHKYTRGVLGIVAGSVQYPGAALLCTQAAVATGVGMIRYLGPQEICRLVNLSTPEAVCSQGSVGESRVQAWLVGPGATGDPDQQARARDALASGLPVVADAGALDSLPSDLGPQVILTPHAGELVRILAEQDVEVTREQVEASPSDFARLAAGLTGATVLLKGATTVISSPSGALFTQDNATPWLATAGSGDTLAGILGALAATIQRELLTEAGIAEPDHWAAVAAMAAAVHGIAGTRAAAGGPVAASDISRALPETVRTLLNLLQDG